MPNLFNKKDPFLNSKLIDINGHNVSYRPSTSNASLGNRAYRNKNVLVEYEKTYNQNKNLYTNADLENTTFIFISEDKYEFKMYDQGTKGNQKNNFKKTKEEKGKKLSKISEKSSKIGNKRPITSSINNIGEVKRESVFQQMQESKKIIKIILKKYLKRLSSRKFN